MSMLASRAYALRRAAAMIAAGPLTFVLALLLAAGALTVPISAASLALVLGPALVALQPVAEVNVFVAPGTPARDVEALQRRLAARPGTVEVRWVRRDDALADLARRFGNAIDSTQAGDNPLPDLLIARLEPQTNPERLEATVIELEQWPRVDAVRTDREGFRRLNALLRLVTAASGAFAALMAVLTLVVVLGAVRLQTHMHADEVTVLKMSGASTGFVIRPYAYGAALLMGLAALLAAGMAYALLVALTPAIEGAAASFGHPLRVQPPAWEWTLAVVAVAVVVGGLAGAASARYSIQRSG